MSTLQPATLSRGFPTLAELCAVQIRKMVDSELRVESKKGTLTPNGPASLSLTTSKVLEVLQSFKSKDSSVTREIPWTTLELIAHPYVLIEYQNSVLPELQKTEKRPAHTIAISETWRAWRAICAQNGYEFKPGDPPMTWEELYFKERVNKAVRNCHGNFEGLNRGDLYLFNLNRSRIKVLEFLRNPWLDKGKLGVLCTLFSEVTALRMDNCTGIEEKEWVAAFSKLKNIEHADLGNHMEIKNEALAALSKNAGRLLSLNISAVSWCVQLNAIINLLRKAPRLESLALGEGKNLQRLPEIMQVLDVCPNLTRLELIGFTQLTVKDVDDILRRYPQIVELKLKDCPNLKKEEMDSLSSHTGLSRLEVIKCKNFVQENLASLIADKFPCLNLFLCCR